MFEWLFGKSFNADTEIPSLDGKVILVTGGNAGIGKETVRQLAKHNPKEIFLAARTASKAEAAIAEIIKETPTANITHLQLDLSDMESVKQAAADFTSRSDRLDILLNNAGIMAVPYTKTTQGYEIQFGTNHMGHALLTKLLLPTLLRTSEESGSDVRIVNLSSEGHKLARFSGGIIYDQTNAEKYGTWTRYGSSKLANILHARALQKRYPQITATALHPGVVSTGLADTFLSGGAGFTWIYNTFFIHFVTSIPDGAKNSLWVATADRKLVKGGHYYTPVGTRNSGSGQASDENGAERLWEWTEEELKKHGV